VLYGLGGSGKTQICLKFCEQFRERCVHIHCASQMGISNPGQGSGESSGSMQQVMIPPKRVLKRLLSCYKLTKHRSP